MSRLLLTVLLGLAPAAAAADSLRCDGGIVSVGDSRLDLLAKCGPPALQESDPVPPGSAVDLALLVERWTYDFGPGRFIQVVSLQGGRVIAVERGGYGTALQPGPGAPGGAPAIPRARCEHDAFRMGDSSYEVLARCGEPFSRELRQGKAVVEVWTYDFGPQVLVRYLEFAGGKLVRIRTGSYGYSR